MSQSEELSAYITFGRSEWAALRFNTPLTLSEADLTAHLQRTAFQQPASYFHHYRDLPPSDARAVADRLWREHHRANLRENILPTRMRADVVLRKRSDHSVGEVWLRET